MDMRQIIKLIFVLSLIIMTSCSTQQGILYNDCNCDDTAFNRNYWNDPFWGMNSWNNPFWGWNSWNDPFWGWNSWGWHRYQRPIYYIYNPVDRPQPPTRYERRQSIGSRPSRVSSEERVNPEIESRPSRVDNTYPQRGGQSFSNEDISPRRSAQPYRNENVTPQRSTQPSRVQNTPSSRVEQPVRVQQRSTTPVTSQPTRSRVQNREN